MKTEDSYICDRCGNEYLFECSYNFWYSDYSKEHVYDIQGWYGVYDGQEMCDACYDNY